MQFKFIFTVFEQISLTLLLIFDIFRASVLIFLKKFRGSKSGDGNFMPFIAVFSHMY
jgi:hypothetical protein